MVGDEPESRAGCVGEPRGGVHSELSLVARVRACVSLK